MRLHSFAIFLALLLPSAALVWKNPDLPQFGKLHDDGLFFVSAKSLATGQGFRILSLPEQPAQTKYPSLYPLYLSLVWRINPHFPENLAVAAWFSWAAIAVSLGLCWVYWRGEGWSESKAWVVVAILAVNPYFILFGTNLFSEIFFLCWLLATLIVGTRSMRQEGWTLAILAGVLGGFAYLSRTAGVALLLSMPAWYLWRRESRKAIAFAAGMLPFIIGWSLWSAMHKFPASNTTLVYYTDYLKFEFLNVGMDNLAVVLWKNFDQLLFGMGSLILPEYIDLQPVKILTQVLGIAMIAGTVRLARRGIAVPYALFALVSAGMLLIWHYPPNQRFVLPLFPILAAGLITELEHLVQMLRGAFRHKDMGQRVVGGAFAMVVLAVLGGALTLELLMTFRFMPREAGAARAQRVETRATYAWIEQHLPPSAGILSDDDPALYLYTSHPGNSAMVMPRWWYAGDQQQIDKFYKDVAPYCRSRGLAYYVAASGRSADDPQLESVFKAPGGTTVFHIR
jgi:hypothetical protein